MHGGRLVAEIWGHNEYSGTFSMYLLLLSLLEDLLLRLKALLQEMI